VLWDQLDRGLALLVGGEEVAYNGLSGSLAFDASGQTQAASVTWWTIEDKGFTDIERKSDCDKPRP
jgi:hypothetical protein